MSTDELHKIREKSKFIFEIRYDPLVQIFDRRGKILEIIHGHFKSKVKHWRVDNVDMIMTDDFKLPSKQIFINHHKASLIFEDPDSFSIFFNDVSKFIELFFNVFPNEVKLVKRLGVRFLSILSIKHYKNHEEIIDKVFSTYLTQNLPLSIKPDDCRIVLTHSCGKIEIGPVKKDENWIKDVFYNPEVKIPEYGFGLDVDSFGKDIIVNSSHDLISSFKSVLNLTQKTENEFTNPLIMGNEL